MNVCTHKKGGTHNGRRPIHICAKIAGQPSPSTATCTERLAVTLLEGAVNLALDIALGHILALVVKLFAAA